jgi:anti-sigma B factor antagonist
MAVSIELEQNEDHWTLAVSGELDYSECAAFRMHVDRVLKAQPPAVIVDLSGIEYLDSSGLGLLLSLSREYGSHGGRMVLITNSTVDSILDLTRLTGIFSIAADREQALELLADTRPIARA